MSFNLLSGQNTSVWFEDNATWHYGYGEGMGMGTGTAGYEKLEVTGDTVINTIEYKIINRIRVFSTGTVQEQNNLYLRYDPDTDQVYRFIDSEESLLYDFSAEMGDTITVKAYSGIGEISFCNLLVDSIRMEVFSDSIQRKVQYCSEIENFQFQFADRIIEGVGSEVFLLPVDQLVCDAGCADNLRCFQDSKITITNPYIECEELITGIVEQRLLSRGIKIYPNPTTGILYIENQSKIGVDRYELMDQTGRIIYIANDPEYFDLEMLDEGVYLLKVVILDHGMILNKIIKK